MAIVSVENLSVAYGDHTVINDLSFSVNEGDFLILIGENGVGKTTLIKALLGQIKPRSGTIEIPQNIKIGYVPQFRNLDEEYPLSIRDFVSLNLKKRIFPWLSKKERARVNRIIRITDLTSIAERPLGLASGGEKQRAYLAQALLPDPQLLILDESTASLDNEMKYELLDLVTRFQQNGLSVIFITHDWDLAHHYGTRFLHMMPDGFEEGPINELPKAEDKEAEEC
jgi:zinc/manganese transport system ATP-binding protein